MARHDGEAGFTQEVEGATHLRQTGVCALCGVSVAWHYDKSHPIVPIERQSAATGEWKKGVDNCVILCHGCWVWATVDHAHSGTSMFEPDDFKFSHGRSGGSHREWVVRMMGRA